MATYKESVGTAVRDIAGEDGVVTGQLWYDTNANEYKYRRQFVGSAWSAVAPTNTAKSLVGGAGIQTAAIIFGGEKPGPAMSAETELFDGSSWTEVNDMTTGRQISAGNAGTYTSALGFGGYSSSTEDKTESWDGTNWTEVGDLNTARFYIAGFGASNTSALASSGISAAPARVGNTESWNGSSWTEVNDLNTARGQAAGEEQ